MASKKVRKSDGGDDVVAVSDMTNAPNVVILNHANNMLSSMKELWESKSLCDVTIRIKDQEFPTYRYMLAAFSPFFRGMFSSGMKESQQNVITLNDLDPEIFQILLNFCYTGEFDITDENVLDLLAAANFFDLPIVREHCEKHLLAALKKLDMHTCIAILHVQLPEAKYLKERAMDVAIRNFHLLGQHRSFIEFTDVDLLLTILGNDELYVSSERDVWDAVRKWCEYDTENRKKDFERLIEWVRFPLFSPAFLCSAIEEAQARIQSQRLHELIEEAKYCHLCPEYKTKLQGKTSRISPRTNLGHLEMMGGNAKMTLTKVRELGLKEVTFPAFDIAGTRWVFCVKKIGRQNEDNSLVEFRLRYDILNDEEGMSLRRQKAEVAISLHVGHRCRREGNGIASAMTKSKVAVLHMFWKDLLKDCNYSKEEDSIKLYVNIMF